MTQFNTKEEFYTYINKPLDSEVYIIKDTLQDFYVLQGYNGSPAVGTINQRLGYSTSNPNTFRYTYPNPHPSASFTADGYEMPINITGDDLRVCSAIDWTIPIENLDTIISELKTLEEVQAQGWCINNIII